MTPPATIRCMVDPSSCSWSYAHERATFRAAQWRMHYRAHLNAAAAAERRREVLSSQSPTETSTDGARRE